MSSEHLVDPELKPALATMVQLNFTAEQLPGFRIASLAMMKAAAEAVETPNTLVETLFVERLKGAPAIRVLSYRPKETTGPLPAILHIHGGGYVAGAPEMADLANRLLAADLGCAIYSVDYRLAPETAYPGPLDDCHAVLQWMHEHAAEQGLDPTRIGVKGESAGGGLAAALALLVRDLGGPALAFQHLIYPMIDDRTCTHPDLHPFVGEFGWTPKLNVFGWTSLLGTAPGGPDISPYAAASRAGDLAGLPPTFLAVGTLDLFLEENLDYAARLTRAGVPMELHVYPGAYHGFQLQSGTQVAKAANRDSKDALRRSLQA